MFGVDDLLFILAGGAFIAREAIVDAREQADDGVRGRLISKFVEEHTDADLERELSRRIGDPQLVGGIWESLEQFKRHNPVWCKRYENTPRIDKYTNTRYLPLFGWQDIGKRRISCYSPEFNHGTLLKMIMQTYGKMPENMALREAREMYPIKPSKRIL